MPLAGFTSQSLPGITLNDREMALFLDQPENSSDLTYDLFQVVLQQMRVADRLSAETIACTCPREYWIKQNMDYTVSLESCMFLVGAGLLSRMVGQAPRYGKLVKTEKCDYILESTLTSCTSLSPKSVMREYRFVNRLPRYAIPYTSHLTLMNINHWIMSTTPGLLVMEFDPADVKWVSAPPIDPTSAEIIYVNSVGSKRTFMRTFEPLESVEKFLRGEVPLYEDRDTAVPYTEALRKWEWKCEYCQVDRLCHKMYRENEWEDPVQEESDF